MKPVRILLSGKNNLQYYVDAVNGLGAEATAKYLPEIDDTYDGLILCGGNDINPQHYHEEIDGSVNIDYARDETEFALLQAYINARKPVLGICRGFQLINIFFGGSLYQDLPDASFHTNKTDFYITHEVSSTNDNILAQLYGTVFTVNSCHHQAIKELGNDLCATAFWRGKYIEAFEHLSLPILAVQWHPERMCFSQARADAVDGSPLFMHFIQMCKKR